MFDWSSFPASLFLLYYKLSTDGDEVAVDYDEVAVAAVGEAENKINRYLENLF